MKPHRFLPVALLLVLVLVAAGCGGGGGSNSVPADAVAVVGNDTITKADFNSLLDGAKRSYAARKQAFPKVGTTQYKQLQDQAMKYLVDQAELEQKAKTLGVTVTDKDVSDRLAQLKQQYFQGNEKQYQAALKKQGLTEDQLRQDLHAQLLSEKLYAKVTGKLTVSDAEVKAYYDKNKTQYTQQASRDVRHILVKSKQLADQIEAKLKSGADFGKLAKQYSIDPGSKDHGGKLTISKGQTVPEFDKVAFTLKTNETSAPVHTQYGWHIIQALSAIRPAKQTPLKDVQEQIRQTLLQQKKTDTMTKWLADVKASYAKKISYQSGYQPASTATTATTGSTTG